MGGSVLGWVPDALWWPLLAVAIITTTVAITITSAAATIAAAAAGLPPSPALLCTRTVRVHQHACS